MYEFLAAFLGVFILAYVLTPLSIKIGLLDRPDQARKKHSGAIPLIGGITIFSSISSLSLFFVPLSTEMAYLLVACIMLTVTGSLDDKYDTDYRLRLLMQIFSAGLLIWGANTQLLSFGDLFGAGSIELGLIGIPITILAVVGMINAYNMMDGIDGLAGGLGVISAISLYLLIGHNIADGARNILLLLIGSLTAYLILNLHLLPKWTSKIFMGDAGSMVLGFILTAFTIR